MTWTKPSPDQLQWAVEVYLTLAYPNRAPGSAVRAKLEALRSVGPESLFESPLFEHDAAEPPTRYALRLGNIAYPHMKLVIERSPDGQSHLFCADTHDRHVLPNPASKEYALFQQLIAANQKLSESIDRAWAEAGLPTFREYLRKDLARRQKSSSPGTSPT
jgi:hypothetical protein